MKKTTLVEGKPVKMEDLPSGSLFKYNNTLAIKSDYRGINGGCECYIVGTGEMFWGGTNNVIDFNRLLVTPVEVVDILVESLFDDKIPYVPFPIAFHTVDVIAIRDGVNGESEVLLGRKPKQTKWQFVGGFVEPTHTAEHTAAKEFSEEAGLLIEDESRFKYIGSAHIKDERYLTSPHQITSSVFILVMDYDEGEKLKAGDDLEEVKWFNVADVYKNIREQHKEIFVMSLVKVLEA